MTKPRTGQSGNWDRERADRLQKDVERMQKDIERLTTERDALAQIKRHIDEVRNGTGWTVQIYGVLLQQCDQYGKTIDTRRAERAEAERDALAAQVARVEKLAEEWSTELDENRCPAHAFPGCDCHEGYHHAWDDLRAALGAMGANQ